MRHFFVLLTFVLIACMSQTSEARKLALLIGVDDYSNVPTLNHCVNDVKTLKESLMKIGVKEDDIQILASGTNKFKDLPTKKNIELAISGFLTNAQPSDIVFLAFSGYRTRSGGTVYFCPQDVKMDDLEGTCVSINKVMNILSYRCQAKFKLVTIEACRSNQTQSPNEIQSRVLEIIPTPSAGIALFMSCAEGEDSCEDLASGKGYFSENLAAALSGEADSDHDGNLTLFEVCKWTTEQTLEQARTKHNKIQRPYFIGSVSDFTLTEDPNVTKAQSAAEEARNAVKTKDYMLAIKKYDEAIALYPRFTSWTIERTMAQELLKSSTSGGNNQTPSVIPSLQAQSITPPPVSPQSESPSEEEQPPVRLSLVQKPSEPYKPGDLMVYKVNGVEFAFRWCPPGRFTMGSPTSEKGRANNNYTNETQHLVTLTKGFWLMETEVTQLQWKAVMGYIPNCRYRGDNLPVESVSWDVCQQFCQKCTEIGLPIQLPTEAQWEYACRAGIMDTYAGNLDEIAWYNERSGKTHPVGTKKPNQWNLYDMHGNVFEWCQDWKGKYSNYPEVDPTGPSSGSFHVYRGGSFCSNFRDCRSAYRNSYSPGFRNNDLVGFRCVNIYAPRLDSVSKPTSP